MNTPTHLLVGAALFAQPERPGRNLAALAGALLPDLAIYVLWGSARLRGIEEAAVWTQLYPSPPWQAATTLGNSLPLYVAAALGGWWLGRPILWIAAASALAHIALDLPLHAADAHAHFWPFTAWRFESPLSYWNAAHHGDVVRVAEFALGLGLTVVLWRRFASARVRGVLALGLLLYLAVPVYFMATLGGG